MTDLDTTFATVGFTTTGFFPSPNVSTSRAIALQSDGKIVMAGDTLENIPFPPGGVNSHVAVCRYNTNGTLDNTFGTGGKATFLIPVFPPSLITNSLTIQPDDSIVVCGYKQNASSFNEMFIVRFTTSGAVDITFGAGGYVLITPALFTLAYPLNTIDNCYAQSIQIDTVFTQTKIVIGGYARGGIPPSPNSVYFFALVRLNLNGLLDSTFGINGLVLKNFSGQDEFGNSLIINLGKYFLSGKQQISTSVSRFAVAKFDNLGVPVLGFGTSGITVIPNFSIGSIDETTSILAQPDNKIVLAGTSSSMQIFPASSIQSYALARVDGNFGTLDASFGPGGTVMTDLSSINLDLNGNSVAIQSDGKIILGGRYYNTVNSNSSFSLARYNVNGSLDTTFGINGNGFILEDLVPGTMQEIGYSIAIQPDGKILVGGVKGEFSDQSDEKEFILARYLSTTPPPPPQPPPPPPDSIPFSPICFPAGTIVKTDQGNIPIEELDPDVHTICSKLIVALTKSYTHEDTIVCIEKHTFGPDVPNKTTHISNNHLIMYKNKLIAAKMFVGKTPRITYKKYTGEIMYNILMEKHYIVTVNNMKVETLNPNHIVATLYRDKHSEKDKKKLILQINEQSINYENFKSNKLNMRNNFTKRKLDIVRHNSEYQTKKNYMSILPRSSHTRDVPSACPSRAPIRFTMRNPHTFKIHTNRNRFTRRL